MSCLNIGDSYVNCLQFSSYAKTKKETETLKLVQKELSRLDNLLYTDVQILRDKIDHACREFDAARYEFSTIVGQGPVVQSWFSVNRGLKFNSLF